MERENKKSDTIAKLLGIIIGIALVLGISYGLYQIFITGKKTNRIITGTLKLDIVETSEENPLIFLWLILMHQNLYQFQLKYLLN